MKGMRTGYFLFLSACAISLMLAENAGARGKQDWTFAALAEAPARARAKANPFAGKLEEAQAGGKLYEQHCAECHGAKAGGTRKGPSLLREEVRDASPGALFWILTNGVVRHGMPVWSKLPGPERWQIVTFLQGLGGHQAVAASPQGEGSAR